MAVNSPAGIFSHSGALAVHVAGRPASDTFHLSPGLDGNFNKQSDGVRTVHTSSGGGSKGATLAMASETDRRDGKGY